MEYFTRMYDDQLLNIGSYEENGESEKGFYTYFPQMLPWIGEKYGSNFCKKLLLIGESHYLPNDADEDLYNSDVWYNEEHTDYYGEDSDVFAYTNTREIINAGSWASKAHSIYREPNKLIGKLLKSKFPDIESGNFLSHIAYYNYFLRPARTGKSLRQIINSTDEKIAADSFTELRGIIKPDAVFFLSKFAFENFRKNSPIKIEIPIDYAPHPASSWWNRVSSNSNGLTGKEKFEKFLIENNIFSL